MLAFAVTASNHGFTTVRAIILGILQGVSELFPISSLGHTVLFPKLFGWTQIVAFQSRPESPWLAFIVMLHVGSAIGLLIYFWRDWVAIVRAFFATLAKRRIETRTERLAWLIIAASIPTGILGLALEHPARRATAKPEIAAIFLVVNGFVLLIAQRLTERAQARRLGRQAAADPAARRRQKDERDDGGPVEGRPIEDLEYREGALLGVAQAGGLIAGISRDGMVMAAGLSRRLDNAGAARISFLMATPIILAAGVYKLPDLTGHLGNGIRGASLVAAIFAAVTAVFTVHFLTRWFKTRTLYPFAIYCVLFGAAMIGYNA